MNRKDLYRSFNAVDDDVLERSDVVQKGKKHPHWLKWSAIAACMCILAAVTAMLFLPEEATIVHDPVLVSTNEMPQITTEPKTGIEKQISELGLEATIVHDPVLVSANEMPQITKEDLLKSIKGQLTVQGVITSLESAVIEDNDSTWYITTMTVSVKEVISGNSQLDELHIVNCAVYTGEADEGTVPVRSLAGCHVGMESVFVLKSLGNRPWEIAGKEVFPLDLGEYYVVYCLDRENDTLIFREQNISVKMDDLTN